MTDPYVPTWAYTKTFSPDGVRKQEDGEVWQDLSAGKSVVDALLAPTSPTKLEERQGRCLFSSMSIYLQSKVGRDVGFPHIRPQQNPKKNDDAERGA